MAFNKFNVILSKQASSDISCIYEYISLTLCIGYAMWTPEKTKLELATELLAEIMPMLKDKQVILCFDSWYAKKKLIDWALSHSNVNIICNARHDTVMWDLPEPTSGKTWTS